MEMVGVKKRPVQVRQQGAALDARSCGYRLHAVVNESIERECRDCMALHCARQTHLQAAANTSAKCVPIIADTGLRHFPEQTAGSSSDDDRQRGFDMRSTAEVYELFEKLQQRQGGGGSQHGGGGGGRAVVERRDASGGQALEEGDQVQRSGPLTGRRRRPGLVNSVDPDDDGTGGFDMRSTAEVSTTVAHFIVSICEPAPVNFLFADIALKIVYECMQPPPVLILESGSLSLFVRC